jgi:hypothetical protein
MAWARKAEAKARREGWEITASFGVDLAMSIDAAEALAIVRREMLTIGQRRG